MNQNARIAVGTILILGGLLFLLDNLNITQLGDYLLASLFGLGGLGFLLVVVTDRRQWWALIPGMILLSVGTIIFVERAFPDLAGVAGGALVFIGLGTAFWIIYFLNRENWWAVIPGGIMFTLAAVVIASELLGWIDAGALFFFGLALTFGVLYLIPTPEGRMTWAIFPAVGCLFVGVAISVAATSLLNFVWPILLILGGLAILLRGVLGARQ